MTERAFSGLRHEHPDLRFTWEDQARRVLRIERADASGERCVVTVTEGGWFVTTGRAARPPHNAMPAIRRLLDAGDRSPLMRGRTG